MRRNPGFGALVLLVLVSLLMPALVGAQDNLLTNGGLEEDSFGPYTTRRGGDFPIYLPNGWTYWFAAPNGDRYNRGDRTAINPHPGPGPNPRQGGRALNVDCGFFSCTAAIFQQVGNITVGANLRATAWALVKACDLPKNAQGQLTADNCGSAIESGSQTRIGIDPNGGSDPNDPDIVWSGWVQPHEQNGWQQMTVDATATGTTVTLYLYSTQRNFADINKTYWDEVALVSGGAGGAAAGAATVAPTSPPSVAFVVPQAPQEDGSIMHMVAAGDTLDSIAFAYKVSRQQIIDLNNIANPRIIAIGTRLIIATAESSAPAEAPPEAAAEPTNPPAEGQPTAEATNPPAEVAAEPTNPPAEAVQPTTPPEPAPVTQVAAAEIDPAATTGTVCVLLFDDANQNRIQEAGEALLPDGVITLNLGAESAGSHDTDGASEPHCFADLAAGDYTAIAAPPQGYGLTTPDQLRLRLEPGVTINLNFGAAQGVQPGVPPPADAGGLVEEAAPAAEPASLTDQLLSVSGLLVFGLAGLVLLGGLGIALTARRR